MYCPNRCLKKKSWEKPTCIVKHGTFLRALPCWQCDDAPTPFVLLMVRLLFVDDRLSSNGGLSPLVAGITAL